MAIFPWTLLITTIWPQRRPTMEGRRAVKGFGSVRRHHCPSVQSLRIVFTSSLGNNRYNVNSSSSFCQQGADSGVQPGRDPGSSQGHSKDRWRTHEGHANIQGDQLTSCPPQAFGGGGSRRTHDGANHCTTMSPNRSIINSFKNDK